MKLSMKLTIYSVAIVILTTVALIFVTYHIMRRSAIDELGLRAEQIAGTTALLIEQDLHAAISGKADIDTPEYQRLQATLRAVQTATGISEPIYTFRPKSNLMEFVVITQNAEDVALTTYDPAKYGVKSDMQRLFDTGEPTHTGLYRSTNDSYISGYGPIKAADGTTTALVSVDLTATDLRNLVVAEVLQLLWIGLLVCLATCVVSLWWVNRITNPVRKTVFHIQDMLQRRDLTHRLEVMSTDEMGELANWFNSYNEQIRQMILDVAASGNELLAASKRLTESSLAGEATAGRLSEETEKVSRNSREASTKLSGIATEAKKSADSVGSMAQINGQIQDGLISVDGAAAEMSQEVGEVARAIEELSRTIQQIGDTVRDARQVSIEASEKAIHTDSNVNQLDTAAREIGDVISLISKITERTNLLALNASIEAARAGEAGRGFAVVANEVKELANQTAEATDNIQNKISAIQSNTGLAIEAIKDIVRIIEVINLKNGEIAAAVEQQTQTAIDIEQSMANSARRADQVSHSVKESAEFSQTVTLKAQESGEGAKIIADDACSIYKASKEVLKICESLDGQAKGSRSGAEQLSQEARRLAELSNDLNQIIATFKV
ncbi:HAMP domain-containing protein [Sulfidibacter corallicola]|uniref:HAMP domain-containing protein n=1 Tax=Sulfidibacter corallicola TaxID=2818388 RepID=A0A8A4TEX8_SULCO|nr:methyl-accepting chemotaxis protein [Sulfidibacter corallicola]QTD48090.1 HAMP domain-containing protein [Sulfidibacter corallicola]